MRVERIQPEYIPEETARYERNFIRDEVKVEGFKEKFKAQDISNDELKEKTEQLNAAMKLFNRKFHFKVHDETNRVIVQVLNSDTGELVSEIPAEKVLDMVAGMEQAIGLIVDARV